MSPDAGPRPSTDLRHDAARRRAVAGHLAEHRREARDRPPARAPRRRHHRGGLPDRLARRLRGGAGDRPRGRGPGRSRAWPAPTRPTSTARGRPYATRERPRIHTFVSTSDIHIVHQLQATREDVKGLARAVGRPGRARCATTSSSRRWTRRAPTSSSPPRSSRSPSTRARRRSTCPTPSATRCPQEYAAFLDAPVRARARPARRRAVRALPRRPRPGRGQLVRRRRWPARGRSSARSTASASARATRRSRSW